MAVDMFFKIGTLAGDSVDKIHNGEIDVLAWSWGLSQSASTHQGGGAGTGKVNVQDLSFTKYIDKSSTGLMLFCCNGKHIPDATLTVRKSGEMPFEYLTVKLEDVLVSAVSTGGSGGESRLTENVTLNFARVHVAYQPQKADGTKDGPALEMGWNIAANSPS